MKKTRIISSLAESYRTINKLRTGLTDTGRTALYSATLEAEKALLRGLAEADPKRDWGKIAQDLR